MIYRKDNWPMLLNNFIESRRRTPFKWGENDCSLFAADCIWEITGVDCAEDIRGKYDSMLGANRIIKTYGSLEKVADILLLKIKGFKTSKALLARGDVALIQLIDGRECLGINLGHDCAFAGKNGIELVPTTSVILGWGVI